MRQLHDKDVGEPQMKHALLPESRKQALRYLMFLKEKRTGKIKGRECVDGRSQRKIYTKEDASSPTAHPESLMISCIIDANEERDVATVDILGTFMQSDTDEETYVKIQGEMSNILVRIDPD